MLEIVTDFTNVMSWLTLGLASVAVALLGLEAWHHHPNRQRAFLGLIVMILVLIATAASLIVLAAHPSQHGPLLSHLLLPLMAPLLLLSFLRLSFAPSPLPFSPDLSRPQHLLLLLVSAGVVLGTSGLVILDLWFS